MGRNHKEKEHEEKNGKEKAYEESYREKGGEEKAYKKDGKENSGRQKDYSELCFTDNFMFCKVVSKNPEICRHMLELILGKRVKAVRIKASEYALEIIPSAKGIRMDVYLDDDEGTVYDLEMQTSSEKNLPKRMRYYQGIIDLNLIEKGDDYEQLPQSVVIFLCTFDYFDQGFPFYVFENRCETMPELLLGDGVKKVLVNPHGNREALPEDAAYFLDYIQTGTAEDDFTRTIDNAVLKARNHQEWRIEYMNWCAYEMDHRIEKRHAREEGREEGWKEGREEGLEEGREEGRKEGREEGRKEGQKRGQKTILLMNQLLLKENRYDDLKRASNDDTFRERLMAELFPNGKTE